jgi:hypothetical protein
MYKLTPEEKAKELVLKMWDDTPNRTFDKTKELTEENYLGIDDAISSAIVCVDEIFNDYQFFLPDTKAAEYWNRVRDFLNAL